MPNFVISYRNTWWRCSWMRAGTPNWRTRLDWLRRTWPMWLSGTAGETSLPSSCRKSDSSIIEFPIFKIQKPLRTTKDNKGKPIRDLELYKSNWADACSSIYATSSQHKFTPFWRTSKRALQPHTLAINTKYRGMLRTQNDMGRSLVDQSHKARGSRKQRRGYAWALGVIPGSGGKVDNLI